MKHATCLAAILVMTATSAFAQAPPAGQRRSLVTSLQGAYANIKQNVTQSAAKLSDADYNFKPGPANMAETRTFAQLFGHIASAQFGMCSSVTGTPNPMQGKDLEALKTKAEVTKALADSFAVCDAAFKSLTDASAMEYVKRGNNEETKAGVLAGMIAHSNEMYGTSAAYIRAKGMVPPSTERAQAGRGRGGN